MRLLRGRRLDYNIVEPPVLALMRERLVGCPCLEDDIEAFVEPRVGLLHRQGKAGELVVAVTLADTEIEPATGEEIERCRLLAQQHRIVPRQHDDLCAETRP